MSALPPIADNGLADRDVRFVPEADIHQLFDYMVGAREWRASEVFAYLKSEDKPDCGIDCVAIEVAISQSIIDL
jgi:hypothetical protein